MEQSYHLTTSLNNRWQIKQIGT